MSEHSSADSGKDGSVSPDQLQEYLAKVADLPALASLLRFMTSKLFENVRAELLSFDYAEEPDKIVGSNADMMLDPLEDAFDTFFEEISGEIVAVRWIRALRDLAEARKQGALDQVKLLEAKVDQYRGAGAWFPPPERLRSELIGFGEDLGEQLE